MMMVTIAVWQLKETTSNIDSCICTLAVWYARVSISNQLMAVDDKVSS